MDEIKQKNGFFLSKNRIDLTPNITQISLYLFVNVVFIAKYIPRAGVNFIIPAILYTLAILFFLFIYFNFSKKIKEKYYKLALYGVIFILVLSILFLLFKINRYNVDVDRWSAVTFFIDGVLQHKYPYGIHTHVSATNFPSPFPIWYVVNFPFYLLGDVGYGLLFFILLPVFLIVYYTKSYRGALLFLLLFVLSPAYWWEVVVRSDSLSNAFLIFSFIYWYFYSGKKLDKSLFLSIITIGLLASTRFSAWIPLALFFLVPFIKLKFKFKIYLLVGIILVLVITFLPFIFWDTQHWIFFKRNPFMSQTSIGNRYVLIIMMVLGLIFAFRWKNLKEFSFIASTFVFLFILTSQIIIIIKFGTQDGLFNNSKLDISYFTLAFPYCIAYISNVFLNGKKEKQ